MSIFKLTSTSTAAANVWARQGMNVTFRAEIMPGKTVEQRTFRIEKVLTNGRVVLENFLGEHREGAFVPLNFQTEKPGKDQNS